MKISFDININQGNPAVIESLGKLQSTLNKIIKTMANQNEQLAAALDRIVAAQGNIAGDVRGLKEAMENQGVDPALIARAESIATSLEDLAAETPEDEQPPQPEE